MEREPGQQERAGAVDPKPGVRVTAGPRKKIPHPAPPLLKRVAFLLLKPESWAEALRYPIKYTLIPLLIVALSAGTLAGIGFGVRFLTGARAFAAGYDARYAPMTYAAGKLTVEKTDPPAAPIRLAGDAGTEIVIDPAGTVTTNEFGDGSGILISDSYVIQQMSGMESNKLPLKDFEKVLNVADGTVINGPYLIKRVHEDGPTFAITLGIVLGLGTVLKECLWALLMIFMVAPMITLAAGGLRMRYRTACRAAAAITIPLIMLGGILSALGLSPMQVMRVEYVPLFWLGAAAALACWTGYMAGKMFKPSKKKPG